MLELIAYKSLNELSVWNWDVQNNCEYFFGTWIFTSKLMFPVVKVMQIA